MTARRVVPTVATVSLDPSVCRGHGICSLVSSGLIPLDEWGFARLDRRTVEGRELRRARAAVLACPAHALSLDATDEPILVAEHHSTTRQDLTQPG